jgi:hypothetical protein
MFLAALRAQSHPQQYVLFWNLKIEETFQFVMGIPINYPSSRTFNQPPFVW